VLPQFYPTHWGESCCVHGIEFVDVVSVGFVLRSQGTYSYILKHDLTNYDIPPEDLLSAALVNLSELDAGASMHLARPPGATVLWIAAEDNFVAVRLLLPAVQDFIQQKIGPRFFFTIPSRDDMFVWNSDAPQELTDQHLREAAENFATDDHNLSPYGYVYSADWPCPRIA
jgi:hypothetical protein